MPASDALIELLALTKAEILLLAERLEVEVPRGEKKFELARRLSQHVTLTDLREVAGEFLAAGQTSLSWVVLQPQADAEDAPDENVTAVQEPIAADTPLTADALPVEELEPALAHLTGHSDPYTAHLRPDDEVGKDPVLVNVWRDGDDLVYFTFAYRRNERLIFHDFDFRREPEDDVFHVVARLSRGVLEVRSQATVAQRVTKGWIATFADVLGRRPVRLHLSQQDVDELRVALNGRMDRHSARFEDEEKGYSRQTVAANVKYPDLPASPNFATDFADSDPLNSDIVFDYTDAAGNTKTVRIRVSPRAGTIQCMNHVSNDVMEHVYDTLRSVRASRGNGSASGATPTS